MVDKPHWYTIKREDDQPFTVEAIYEDDAVIKDSKVRSFSMLTINADHEHAHEYFFELTDEYVTFSRDHSSDEAKQSDLF